jgi:hypothetical protein
VTERELALEIDGSGVQLWLSSEQTKHRLPVSCARAASAGIYGFAGRSADRYQSAACAWRTAEIARRMMCSASATTSASELVGAPESLCNGA